jgi:hypothetical protein
MFHYNYSRRDRLKDIQRRRIETPETTQKQLAKNKKHLQ